MDDLNEVRKVSEAAYRFLSRINPKDCQDGHYGLPDGVFANIQTYMPKPKRRYRAVRRKQQRRRISVRTGGLPDPLSEGCPHARSLRRNTGEGTEGGCEGAVFILNNDICFPHSRNQCQML